MTDVELRSPPLRVLVERGFVKDCTDLAGLDHAMSEGVVPAYVGFDLTAPSLHVGSMIPLMAMRHLRRAALVASGFPEGALGTPAERIASAGVDAVHMVLGDATTRVGDPSDKDGARPILTDEAIAANWPGIRDCIWSVVGGAIGEHFNSQWLDRLSFMDFLTGPARETSLNRMVASDVVRRRLDAERPMTLMELIYQSMQGMDFAHLANAKGIRLQLGGSDQWTNVLMGVDLARRLHGIETFGITTPLLTDATGRKMGKTAGGTTVWLHPDRTSSFDLWQFWRNVPDEKVREFLGLFTDLPMDEVRMWGDAEGSALGEAKAILATEAVAIAHGRDAAEAARSAATVSSARDPGQLDADAVAGLPAFVCPEDPDRIVVTVTELLVLSGLAKSKGDARRLAAGGAIRVNGARIEFVDVPVETRDFSEGQLVLSSGRKRHVRILATDQPPSNRPVSARVAERADASFEIIGTWTWGSHGDLEEDCLAGPMPTRGDAETRMRVIRFAEPK
jgi:tyrosyl-tRNA synthetase